MRPCRQGGVQIHFVDVNGKGRSFPSLASSYYPDDASFVAKTHRLRKKIATS